MGWFNKIRNILFEEEEEEIPTYPKKSEEKVSKKEIKHDNVDDIKRDVKVDVKRDVNIESQQPSIEENVSGLDSIMADENVRRRSVRRDVDVSLDDIMDELPGNMNSMPKVKDDYVAPPKPKERKPIFQNFDEEEFDRLNNRPMVELRKDRYVADENITVNEARKANNNFSSTTTGNKNNNYRDPNRYKLDSNPTKKPFSPSPVISPVYGILDKNYSKDDIVDKKDGIKREIIKPINRQEISSTIKVEKKVEEEVTIDSIRRKAYGDHDDYEKKTHTGYVDLSDDIDDIDLPFVKDEVVEEIPEKIHEEIPEEIVDNYDEDRNLEDIISSQMEDNLTYEEDLPIVDDEEEVAVQQVKPKRKMMDDIEKTSTLQILDDIEKELNSIKPSREVSNEDDSDEGEENNNDNTLETDLFNLIDSMYNDDGKGEEEDDW